jgi:steroid delta-isomerase-like uncharacterized protein
LTPGIDAPVTAGCDEGAVMECSVSTFEAVAVMSLPVWLIVEGVLASLRPASPPSRKGSPRARAGVTPARPRRAASPLAALVAVTVLPVVVLGGCAGTPEAGAPRDTAALERVLDEWAIAWSSGDVERLLALFTEDVHYEDVTFGAVHRSKDALRDFATAVFGSFTDLRFEPRSRFVAADGKWGAIEWVWRGRQTKDLPGLPATNTPFEVRGSAVVEFRDGKIARNSDYWDLTTYLKQVGLAK